MDQLLLMSFRCWPLTILAYLTAVWEVHWAMLTGKLGLDHSCNDLLPAIAIPSVRRGNTQDRDLATIDQDGAAFAVDEVDGTFFNTRSVMLPRKYNLVQIVLRDQKVRIKKTPLRASVETPFTRMLTKLKYGFYMECAALLRLHGYTFVPQIRKIEWKTSTFEMDYIWGRDLRSILADGEDTIDYESISRSFRSMCVNSRHPLFKQIAKLVADVEDRGVVNRDLSAGNFVVGGNSKSLYMVDFSFVDLRPLCSVGAKRRDNVRIVGRVGS